VVHGIVDLIQISQVDMMNFKLSGPCDLLSKRLQSRQSRRIDPISLSLNPPVLLEGRKSANITSQFVTHLGIALRDTSDSVKLSCSDLVPWRRWSIGCLLREQRSMAVH
jgi:hypothetical protein